MVSAGDAEKLADALQVVDNSGTKEYLGGVIELCSTGAFMVEPWGAEND